MSVNHDLKNRKKVFRKVFRQSFSPNFAPSSATRKEGGFTLIETLVSIFIFSIMLLVVYKTAALVTVESLKHKENTAMAELADEYIEVARNLPYSEIGTIAGNPNGPLPDLANQRTVVYNNKTYKLYYAVSYVDDPADGTIVAGTDFAPNDYKQIKFYVKNEVSGVDESFLTNISPQGLEDMEGGGALYIQVIDAVGQPVPNATVQITNNVITPAINLTRTTDAAGIWVEVGLATSSNSYHIDVTKSGYSSDGTLPADVSNPNPVKPDSTILEGQVTSVSFAIDRWSSLAFNTLDSACNPLSGINMDVKGAKLIGLPSLLKFSESYTTNGSGNVSITPLEWDSYDTTFYGGYMLYGSSPVLTADLLPNTNQEYNLILGPATARSFLVVVKDASGNPIEGAEVRLQSSGLGYDSTKLTGGSLLSQSDWTGGGGQADFADPAKYFDDDGNVSGTPSGLTLKSIAGSYALSGYLTSSTFDTGTASTTYTIFTWQPTSQSPDTELKFQFASNNDNSTWDFAGPDGTSATYYTVPGTTIHSSNSEKRYFRYRAFLSTTDNTKTPVLTSADINYISGCYTPGQAMFAGLAQGTDYALTVSKTGFQTQSITDLTVDGEMFLSVTLTP